MFRSSQNSNMKTPGSVMKKKQQQKQMEHDLIIKDNEIIDCLYELGIAFTAEDLKKPSPAKVQYLFEVFVDMLMGVRKESVEPIIRSVEDNTEFPETQHDAALLMAFHRSLSQLMYDCGVHDFSFGDLVKPDDGRLRFILSNVINFLRFRGERMGVVESYFQKAEQAKERMDQLYYENEELAKRVENLKAQRKREEPAIKEAHETNMKLTDDLRALKKKQTSIMSESDEMKQEKKVLMKKMEDRQYFIQENSKIISNLKPYIMDSPEKLHQIITDMGSNLSTEKGAVEAVERRSRALQTSADSFSIVEQDVSSCLVIMEACESELVKVEEYNRKTQRHQEIKSQRDSEEKEVDRLEKRLERALKNATEKLNKAREQGAVKRQATKEEMRKLKEEYEQLSSERDKTNKDMERKRLQIDQTEKKMADLKEAIDDEIRQAQIEYERLEHHIQLYISEMEQVIA